MGQKVHTFDPCRLPVAVVSNCIIFLGNLKQTCKTSMMMMMIKMMMTTTTIMILTDWLIVVVVVVLLFLLLLLLLFLLVIIIIIMWSTDFSVCDVQCQIELPKLVSELDSNQLVTSSLLAELNYFLETQHQLIDNYRAAYTAGNTSLEDVANGIPYDVITSTVNTKKVRRTFILVVGRRKVGKASVFCSARCWW